MRTQLWYVLCLAMLVGCQGQDAVERTADTCTGTWPSYWQDPDPKFAEQWAGQVISNQPPAGWSDPVFRLSDGFPQDPVDERAGQPWRGTRFDALFDPETSQQDRRLLAEDYIWAVMSYIQEGNIGNDEIARDWDLCNNDVRPWFHMPFQTYDGLTGREFVHGLTREAPVTFNLADPDNSGAGTDVDSTMWAVGFYNATAAYTLGKVWNRDGSVAVPTTGVSFDEGAVVGKLLFIAATPEQFPLLENMPAWTANISDPGYCQCKHAPGEDSCTLVEESQQCGRSTTGHGPVRLLQFDVAIKDSRATDTQWVFGTFVADGERKASESNVWNRISPLGLMWGNDTPPEGAPAVTFPSNPRQNGFEQEVIFWDVVDMLNAAGGPMASRAPGHLGCNSRLNGPADNANSSCMSCHMTGSVPDSNMATPPIVTQFSGGAVTSECVTANGSHPTRGVDASGKEAEWKNGITFAQVDGIWFENTLSGEAVNMTVQTHAGPKNVLGDEPVYADGRENWITTDYSLQLSGALGAWMQWRHHADTTDAETGKKRVWKAKVPRRGMMR